MALNNFPTAWFSQAWIYRFFTVATLACTFWIWGGSYQPVRAEVESVAIDMPIYGHIPYRDLIAQAESLVSNAVSQQFSQNSDLSTLRVVVTISRHGEVIPVLTTTVSREQWQETPQVNAWTDYYTASYDLLQRYEGENTGLIARVPSPSMPSSSISEVQRRTFQIDQAYDEGRLTGAEAQDYLTDLD